MFSLSGINISVLRDEEHEIKNPKFQKSYQSVTKCLFYKDKTKNKNLS